jgi:hypothetical protein
MKKYTAKLIKCAIINARFTENIPNPFNPKKTIILGLFEVQSFVMTNNIFKVAIKCFP